MLQIQYKKQAVRELIRMPVKKNSSVHIFPWNITCPIPQPKTGNELYNETAYINQKNSRNLKKIREQQLPFTVIYKTNKNI